MRQRNQTNNKYCSERNNRLTRISKHSNISEHRIKVNNTLIFPIATYASETWTMANILRKRNDALEIWVYQRTLRNFVKQRGTNVSISVSYTHLDVYKRQGVTTSLRDCPSD